MQDGKHPRLSTALIRKAPRKFETMLVERQPATVRGTPSWSDKVCEFTGEFMQCNHRGSVQLCNIDRYLDVGNSEVGACGTRFSTVEMRTTICRAAIAERFSEYASS